MLRDQGQNSQIYTLNHQNPPNQTFTHTYHPYSPFPRHAQNSWALESKSQERTLSVYQFFDDQNNDSDVSLQGRILYEHLECLQWMVNRLTGNLFKIAQQIDQSIIWNQNLNQNEQTLYNYFSQHKSLIPQPYLPFFIELLQSHNNLRAYIKWMYEHVESQLGNELILVVYRIILAYLPVRQLCSSQSIITNLSQVPFNIINIYSHTALKILSPSKLYQFSTEGITQNSQLYQFYQDFMSTTILVYQQYFENPIYTKIALFKLQSEKQIEKQRLLLDNFGNFRVDSNREE